jgi:hypothetical protein
VGVTEVGVVGSMVVGFSRERINHLFEMWQGFVCQQRQYPLAGSRAANHSCRVEIEIDADSLCTGGNGGTRLVDRQELARWRTTSYDALFAEAFGLYRNSAAHRYVPTNQDVML